MLQDLFPSSTQGPFGRRLKHARGGRIPVTLVTGFLGAGKTTLVRRFLESPEGQGTAVIVNEFGAVGIDDALIRTSTEQTALLGNGCVCCIARSDLQMTLRRLLIERERGDVPHFRRVLIETSGLADPAPILQTFATDRALGDAFHLEVMLAVVDAASGGDTLRWSSEARRQAILADRLVVSKIDLVGEAEIAALEAQLRDLNPRASLDRITDGRIEPRHLTDAADRAGPRAGFVAEASHSDGISSFVLTETTPIAWEPFARTVEALIVLRGRDLLRVKGFLNVAGCKGPVLVQFVQHLTHPPVELATWPDADHSSRVVFITRHVSERAVRDLYAAMMALSPQPAPPRSIS